MASKSTQSRRSRKASGKPPKPYADFPLSPHASGCWQKKIRGKVHYFGKWGRRVNGVLTRVEGDGWKEALEIYKALADDLHAGRTPRQTSGDGLPLRDLCNRFLTSKHHQLEAGELAPRTFTEYKRTTDRLVAVFGKDRFVDDLASDDFEALRADIAKTWGPIRLGNEVQRVRSVFKYGYEAGLIDRPVRFGPAFKKPTKAVLRKHRAAGGQRMYTAEEVRALLEAASPQMRAMILLGINAGFGNHDCATLPLSAVDLERGWIRFPRPKTGIDRRCPLWTESVAAIRKAIASRPQPKDEADADFVFITKYGKLWVGASTASPVSAEMRKLLLSLEINGRKGLGFYSLRHTFRTVADATRDFPAIRVVMGHADNSIDDVYREHIDDDRLEAVAEHVRGWLWPSPMVG